MYYLLYANDYEMASKVAIDPGRPSLGRIRADFVVPQHSPASILRCISRVERTPELAHADLFADTSSDTPLKEGHIAILRTDGPGVSPNEPMTIVLLEMPIVQVESSPIPDGKYFIKNRAKNLFWVVKDKVRFWLTEVKYAKNFRGLKVIEHSPIIHLFLKWDITHDSNGNIFIRSLDPPSYPWVGEEITLSTVPVPWRLIPADIYI